MTTFCLIIGHLVTIAGALAATAWVVSIPMDYAWRRMRANKTFIQAWCHYAREGRQ